MKVFKKLVLLVLVFVTFKANAQTDKATTTKIVEEKNYVFVATSATPLNSADINKIMSRMPGNMNGGNINLSGSSYDVRVVKDSVIAYLPYYGRSYSASMNPDEQGYKFTSTDFIYDSKKNKRGWNINIKTKDVRDNVQMNLSISQGGYATLSVVSNNKQSITYNGYLSEVKK
ncbi:DUF4251 domain-containing protein [Pedobacter polaris]|uniref:DUF4251 domain-containing protein n=1 Tax=Pedobacter polaris TaxID=2571273 RepID=A0A4U1CTZ3_9SPHI|nr:DUF4251 domain-containing protein [Pedobacter polaris]TKC12273.1 DUF4251 domain-containing protein [Pedobacter polaris]